MTKRLRQSSILDSFSKQSCDDRDLINLLDHTDEEQVDDEESQTQEQQNLSDHTDDSDEEQVDNDDHNVSEALEHEESQTQEQETVCETTECLSCCCANKPKPINLPTELYFQVWLMEVEILWKDGINISLANYVYGQKKGILLLLQDS